MELTKVQNYIQNVTKNMLLITNQCNLSDNSITELGRRLNEFYVSLFEESKGEYLYLHYNNLYDIVYRIDIGR